MPSTIRLTKLFGSPVRAASSPEKKAGPGIRGNRGEVGVRVGGVGVWGEYAIHQCLHLIFNLDFYEP